MQNWQVMSNTKTIAKNTGWYGLENAISIFVTMVTSIAIARTLGPTKMGYIIYVVWIAQVSASLGSFGIPATMRKYMAEFLGMGDRGTARYVYARTLLMQMGLAALAAGGVVCWVLSDAHAGYRLASVLVALSIWPGMVNSISAQANIAAEELSANLPGSIVSMIAFFFAIAATVVFKWGVVGVGAAMLAMRTIDCLVRLIPTMRRIMAWETTHVQPPGLRNRMLTFAWQSVTSTAVALIVWDRSEFFLLKHLCSDIRQVAFYSVAFSMAEKLLLSASIFGTAIGATIFAQYGRDKTRVPEITASAFRYLALSSIPLHVIATSLAAPLLLLLYGKQYIGALSVATLAPILCLPKAFLEPARNLLQSAERQSLVIFATALAGVVDIGVAWSLIPAHGAVGACIGSGAAQITAIGILWGADIYLFKVKLPWTLLGKIIFISTVAALTAHFIAVQLSPLWGVLCGGSAALVVLFALFYFMRVLEPQDLKRFTILSGMLPKRIAGPVNAGLSILIRPALSSATPTGV
jgi:O-antigen/teichoic acid export membrane protein